jgi:hypothetical protein
MHAAPSKTAVNLDQIGEHLRSLLTEGRTDEAIEMVLAMLSQLQTKNVELVLKLMKMERERSGRRSERMDPKQISLMLELIAEGISDEADRAATEEEDKTLDAERAEIELPAARRVPRRRRPSKDLPREVVSHDLAPEERLCRCCGEPMTKIGEDVSEIVELIPAQFLVEEHHQSKYACSRCKETVVTAPGPEKLIEKGLPGPVVAT